jgi:hypothetical protein
MFTGDGPLWYTGLMLRDKLGLNEWEFYYITELDLLPTQPLYMPCGLVDGGLLALTSSLSTGSVDGTYTAVTLFQAYYCETPTLEFGKYLNAIVDTNNRLRGRETHSQNPCGEIPLTGYEP